MSDNLNKLEIEILDVLYKRECEDKPDLKIEDNMFSLPGHAEPSQELGYYLEQLKRNNYLDFKEKSLLRGGWGDSHYKSNVLTIWWDDIHISYKGKKFIKEYRLTKADKIKKSIKNFGSDVLMEMRAKIVSHIATFILGIIVSYVYYLIFIK